MSKQHKIRWNANDEQELKRVVRNYNAKINRLIKKNPSMKNVLPEKVSVGQMRKLINTRQDLKREINALKRFSKRGSEKIVDVPGNDYNLKTTKWQKEEMTRRIGIINRKRKARLKELAETELTSRGESLGYTKAEIGMGRAEIIDLMPMNAFSAKMSRSDLNKKFENILKESQSDYWGKRDYLFKENYIKALEEHFSKDDVADIVEAIKGMDIKDFMETAWAEDYKMEYPYWTDKDTYDQHLKALKTIWIPNKG